METAEPDNFDCYECDEDDCDLPEDKSLFICENAISCWKSTVRDDDGTERNARGCIGNPQQVRLLCTGSSQHDIQCCKENLCNDGAFPTLQPPEIREPGMNSIMLISAIVALSITVVFITILLVMYYRRKKKYPVSHVLIEQLKSQDRIMKLVSELNKESTADSSTTLPSYSSTELKIEYVGNSTIKEYFDGESLTSGSGSGVPLMKQKTFSDQISLVKRMDRGKFGHQLWRGIWQDEIVVVKVFPSRSEILWARETEVYTRLLPSKHDNILGYLGNDTASTSTCTQFWIVTHYYAKGSLRNYLKEKRLEYNEMFKACLSLAYGMLYLHTEIFGSQGKLAIAHRNFHSKNIFVKNDGSCVIGEFEHAVTQDRLRGNIYLDGVSKRYMSPEILERPYRSRSMDSFRESDIYSLSLVLWEICRRCNNSEKVILNYAVPYSEMLLNGDQEPTLEEMRQLVVINERRPDIPEHWQLDQTLAGIGSIIQECWSINPAVRLTILRIKKSLIKLASNNPEVILPLGYDLS